MVANVNKVRKDIIRKRTRRKKRIGVIGKKDRKKVQLKKKERKRKSEGQSEINHVDIVTDPAKINVIQETNSEKNVALCQSFK